MMHSVRVDRGQKLLVDGIVVNKHVTPQEEQILRVIMRHTREVSKDFIMTAVYGGRNEPDIKIVDVIVCRLRTKLGEHRLAIETIWGRGYARNRDYFMIDADPSMVAIPLDAALVNAVSYGARETPDALITRLLTEEQERQWSLDTAEVA